MNLPIRKLRIAAANWFRARRHVPRFLMMTLSGEVSEISPPRLHIPLPFVSRFLPPDPPNVFSLRRALEQIAIDPRVDGVVLQIECLANGATFQSLRRVLLDFRTSGKRLIAYAHSFGPFQYYLACACDQIVMPPSAEWSVIGLLREYVFFKDAFDALGIGIEVVNVSPFKSAFDNFAKTDFSEESRAQAEWVMNAQYDELVRGISEGRHMSAEQVRGLIDAAPFGASDAVARGLLDAALYEDELEDWLAPAKTTSTPLLPNKSDVETASSATTTSDIATTSKAKVAFWRRPFKKNKPIRALELYGDVYGSLLIPYVKYTPKLIGIVRVEGTIMEGRSQSLPLPIPLPLLGNRYAGAESVAQALRYAAEDDHVAAVVLYVDSGGGSALASDLIAREVRRIREVKPVVAYMAGVAASGGYYVSALAQHIVAQPLTITGSIGVITMKPNLERAESKLLLHRTILKRGEHAGVNSLATPLNPDEYASVAASIQRVYDAFKRIVAEGRKLSVDEMEPICGGRVWTGEMARERGLVDELGDLRMALEKARDLANMPADCRPRAAEFNQHPRYRLPSLKAAAAIWDMTALKARFLSTRAWAILPWGAEKGD
jgi:protease IV